MKKILGLGVVVMLILSTLLSAIPTGAVSAGPYNYTKGVIQNVTINTTKNLGGNKATYYKATVSSLMHNESSRQQSYSTHIVVGSKQTKFFVYSGESSDKMDYKKMSVHDMVVAFEKENPAWQVVAAINGDFFNTSTGEPESPMIQNGDMLKSSYLADMTGRGMVGIDDKTGKAVYYTIGSYYTKSKYGEKITFNGAYQVQVLGPSQTNPIISYKCTLGQAPSKSVVSFTTPDFGQGNYAGKTVYVVDLERYRMDTGSHNGTARTDKNYFVEGKIVKKISGTANMKPSEGQAYIAVNSVDQAPYIKVGAYIKCQKVLSGAWENVSNAIGFKQQLLADGNLIFPGATYSRYHHSLKGGGDVENSSYYCSCGSSLSETEKWTEDIYDYPMCWKQRTAIGFKADGTCVLMTVGKSNGGSWAATYVELGTQLKALGCTNGFLLDGGGSSTMLIREGDSLNTVFHAEEGSGGEGRIVANTAIIAVRKSGVALPKQDPVVEIETEKPTEKPTEAPTTEAPTEAPTMEAPTTGVPEIDVTETDIIVTETPTIDIPQTEIIETDQIITDIQTEPATSIPIDTGTPPIIESETLPITDPVIIESETMPMTDPITMAPTESETIPMTEPPTLPATEIITQAPTELVTEPITQAPATEPVTQAPIATEPVTQAPIATEPVTQAPIATEPVTQAPIATEPVTQAPIATEPVTQAPVVTEPVTQAPVVTEPVTQAPIVTEPVTLPVTEPVTLPVTEPVTLPVTEPVTLPSTAPATMPSTDIGTQQGTAADAEIPTVGCGATVALPALLVTGGLTFVGIRKKKNKKDE